MDGIVERYASNVDFAKELLHVVSEITVIIVMNAFFRNCTLYYSDS